MPFSLIPQYQTAVAAGAIVPRAFIRGEAYRQSSTASFTVKTTPKYHSLSAFKPLMGVTGATAPGRSGCQSSQGTASWGGLPVYLLLSPPCHNQTRVST